jgi:hypothetical protein
MSDDPTMQRLDDQIEWYDQRSNNNQRAFKLLKVLVIAAAALIPLLAGLPVPVWVAGVLGVVIAVTEGVQQLNQYHANWIAFRSTCEALKHEKFLYLGKAGPYAAANDAHALLAERIESLVSQEHAKWASGQERTEKTEEHPQGQKPVTVRS